MKMSRHNDVGGVKVKYRKKEHLMLWFLGLFMSVMGAALPFRYPSFDSWVVGIVVFILGASALVLFGHKSLWLSSDN